MSVAAIAISRVEREVTVTMDGETAEKVAAVALALNWARNAWAQHLHDALRRVGIEVDEVALDEAYEEMGLAADAGDPPRGGEDDVMVIDPEDYDDE